MASHRIAILADPDYGFASFSWRVKCHLESAGNCVFWFDPGMWPGLYGQSSCVDVSRLCALIKRWGVDFVFAADGVALSGGLELDDACRFGIIADSALALQRTLNLSGRITFGFSLVFGAQAKELSKLNGVDSFDLSGAYDSELFEAEYANEHAVQRHCLCFDDSAASRAWAQRSEGGLADLDIANLSAKRSDATSYFSRNESLYQLRFADFVVEPEGGLEGYQLYLAQGFNLPASSLDKEGLRGLGVLGRDEDMREAVVSAFSAVADRLGVQGREVNCEYICALGYYGFGNFGDEFILSVVASRLASEKPGAITIAVGENPLHTLVNRGIYSVTLADKFVLSWVLQRACVSIVTAGLLFDQGIRWTMGCGELLSPTAHTDLPGIAGFVALGRSYGVKTVFYGIGAGPLEHPESKRLVRLCGELGSRFLARDGQTARLVEACGVDASQVSVRADAAFTSEVPSLRADDARMSKLRLEPGTKLLAVSLRSYENAGPGLVNSVAGALSAFLGNHDGVKPVFCILEQDDLGMSRQVIKALGFNEESCVFNPGDDVDAMAGLLSSVDLGLCMRYHASLLVNKAGHPCVGLGYLPKVGALYQEMGVADELLLPMDADADAILSALCRAYEDRGRLAGSIEDGGRRLAALARESEAELLSLVCLRGEEKEGPILPRSSLGIVDEVADFRRELCDLKKRFVETTEVREELYRLLVETQHDRDRLGEKCDVVSRERDAAISRSGELDAELSRVTESRDQLQGRVEELESSTSYKIGRAITKVPGTIKRKLINQRRAL